MGKFITQSMHSEGGAETMIKRDIKIDHGMVDYDTLKTDEDIRREARRILPQVLAQIGEAMGEETWNLLQKSLKGSGLNTSASSVDKKKFIREAGQEHKYKASAIDKNRLEKDIIRQLRETIEKHQASTG